MIESFRSILGHVLVAAVSSAIVFLILLAVPETSELGENGLQFTIAFFCLVVAMAILLSPFLIVYNLFNLPAEKMTELTVIVSPPIPLAYAKKVLAKYCHYYNHLNKDLQTRFETRVETFIAMKVFHGRDVDVTHELKILIAACAVQLTFGLKSFEILSFRRIYVYPDTYYSSIRQTFHKGEVNLSKRIIILSATNFLHGIAHPNDGVNLGIHELTHALNMDKLIRKDDREFLKNLDYWEEIAAREMLLLEGNPNHFLRQYASTNIHEMLSVSTEYFFEKPEEFRSRLPELFNKMSMLYGQDPSNRSNPIQSS